MSKIEFFMGGRDDLKRIEPLWEELNQHHIDNSIHFKERFKGFTFQRRMERTFESDKEIFVIIAHDENLNKDIGYCFASVENKRGEIESLYLRGEYRGQNIGERLMRESLDWIEGHGVDDVILGVAAGNENAFGFYEKFGFYPRVTKLGLKK